MSARVASKQVMEALDLPSELAAVQDGYWQAQSEWEQLDRAYRIVVSDLLRRKSDGDIKSVRQTRGSKETEESG